MKIIKITVYETSALDLLVSKQAFDLIPSELRITLSGTAYKAIAPFVFIIYE